MQMEWATGDTLEDWLPDLIPSLLDSERAVPLYELVFSNDLEEHVTLSDLRTLYTSLRTQGFLKRAAIVAEALDVRGSSSPGSHGRLLQAELAVLTGNAELSLPPLSTPYGAKQGRVLQVVGTSLPDIDSTYTRRTQELAQQGPRLGLEISVATQMGISERDKYDVDDVDGINYHRLPGPARGALPFDEWVKLFVKRLSAVVRKVRPSVLVASSDFVNGIAALAVCHEYGIKFVYDVRGLWEDSWLIRQRNKYSWSQDQIPNRWGIPDVWTMRRGRETEVILGADSVVASSAALGEQVREMGVDPKRLRVIASSDENVSGWADIFEQTTTLPPASAALARVDYTAEELIQRVKDDERLPLGNVAIYGGFGSVKTIRDHGWRHGPLEPIKIALPFDWVSACGDHRSQAFHLHAWDFMVPFLKAWETHRDADSLLWCLQRAADWASTFNDGRSHGTMAWYDMAIGLRAPRLAYLVQEAVHAEIGMDIVDLLTRSVICHERAIFAPQAFNADTNHGFYTAVGQLSFAKRLRSLPGMEIVSSQGEERLRLVTATQFASDGGHLEHSPDYHRMLVSSFLGAMADGLLTDPEVATRIERAEEVMGWFLRPDHTVVQIGDSPERVAARDDRAMKDPHTAFLVTDGREGEPNPQELLMLYDSGYGIVRSPQPVGRRDHLSAGYLTFMAGFHSRAHKHCDDLSVTWFDGGHELLIDSGRFGYLDVLPADSPQREEGFFYGRPERQYVERVRAHNTIQVDDQEHERRGREPYGSALVSGEERAGLFQLTGKVDHGTWTHLRTVTFKPGLWLLVEDAVNTQDRQPHDFTVWWNLPGELTDLVLQDDRVALQLPGGRPLYVTALNKCDLIPPVKGQGDPLRGWRSATDYSFTPSWSLGHKAVNRTEHTFVTLLSLDNVPDISAYLA